MTESQDNAAPFSQELGNDLLRFRVPEVQEVEVVMVRLADGRIVARTAEELETERGQSDRGIP